MLQCLIIITSAAIEFTLHKSENVAFDRLQDKNWAIVDFSKRKVEQLKQMIPLIADLRNPALRDRY